MDMNKFLVAFVASLLSISIFMSIFYFTTDFSVTNSMEYIFEDLYDYADLSSQEKIISKLDTSCTSIIEVDENLNLDDEIKKMREVCNNEEKIIELKNTCQNINVLESQMNAENFENLKESCISVNNGEFDDQCDKIKSMGNEETSQKNDVDFSEIRNVCIDYKDGLINEKTLFTKSTLAMIPKNIEEEMGKDMPLFAIFEKIEYFKQYAIFFIPLFFFIMLFLYLGDIYKFWIKFAGVLIGIGIMILFPFLLLNIYVSPDNIDTTPILESAIAGNGQIDFTSAGSIAPLIMLRMYTRDLLIVSSIILFIECFCV